MKRTPLYEKHRELGGKMIAFGGWELPVQYTGILEEHRQVRTAAGLFDVSHMGEILVRAKTAKDFFRKCSRTISPASKIIGWFTLPCVTPMGVLWMTCWYTNTPTGNILLL